MPELPEVEAARRAVEEHCSGKRIKKAVVADDPKVIDGVSSSEFEAALLGKQIVGVHRKGKNMWLLLDSPPFPSFQFGMTGAVYIKGVAVTKYKRSAVKETDEWPSKYSKVFIELDDGLELSFTDKRRFARVRLLTDPTSVPPISELGPDALLEPMTVDELAEALSKKKIAIKKLLLDQSFMAGIGNWVADEVLYQAGIHPLETASKLPKEKCATLHKCIQEVIEWAVQVDAESSLFPLNWLFHYRWGKKPGKANGRRIDFITAGGRTTAYVPALQKLSGGAGALRADDKQRRQTSKRKKGSDEVDGSASEEEEAKESVKVKKQQNPRASGRKSSAKKKPDVSNDGSDDPENDESDEDEERKKVSKTVKKKEASERTSKKKSEATGTTKKHTKRAK
ncbi:formamidopyrimidine-DNA glycosylase isoform X2 [Punica granatum]|uniref:Formamidopyrimidine-DNA glycosylase isoform X2 n=1 Tax=Punica granatum TaxID=22663 RepID=A0A6P8CJZ9_PUNGR|nr:formamidopyrimidine-DNA glycosylase isoform X2 [Punica granatum]